MAGSRINSNWIKFGRCLLFSFVAAGAWSCKLAFFPTEESVTSENDITLLGLLAATQPASSGSYACANYSTSYSDSGGTDYACRFDTSTNQQICDLTGGSTGTVTGTYARKADFIEEWIIGEVRAQSASDTTIPLNRVYTFDSGSRIITATFSGFFSATITTTGYDSSGRVTNGTCDTSGGFSSSVDTATGLTTTNFNNCNGLTLSEERYYATGLDSPERGFVLTYVSSSTGTTAYTYHTIASVCGYIGRNPYTSE